jgi:hypothetical protein
MTKDKEEGGGGREAGERMLERLRVLTQKIVSVPKSEIDEREKKPPSEPRASAG